MATIHTTVIRKAAVVTSLGVAAVLTLTVGAAPAAALDPRTGDDLTVDADETVDDDLYVAADTLTVEGTVAGDLVVAARRVVIDGTVEGDLIGAAQSVVVTGAVEDDVRVAVAELVVEDGAEIGDDTIVFGYALEAQEGSTIGGDVVVTGRQGVLDGQVAETLWGTAEGIEIGGAVGGDVDVTVGGGGGGFEATPQGISVSAIDGGLAITDSAVIDGDVRYRSPSEADIAADARIAGDVVFDEVSRAAPEDDGVARQVLGRIVDALRTFGTLFLVGFLLVSLLPRAAGGVSDTLRRRPWVALGWGVLFFPVVGVLLGVLGLVTILLAVLLGVVTLGGLAGFVVAAGLLAAFALAFAVAVAVALLAPLAAAFLVGRLILRRSWPDDLGGRTLALLVGVAIYAVLQALPFVGWIVALVATLFGLGAIIVWAWTSRRRRAAAVTGPVPAVGTPALPYQQ